MEELAKLLNSTRLSVSKALNELEAQGLLELYRGEIVVPDAKVFFSWNNKSYMLTFIKA